MSGLQDGKKRTINQNVSINVDFSSIINATEAAENLGDALTKISKGKEYASYWNSQKSSIEGVADAYERFTKSQNKFAAAGLVKSTNSFLAQGGQVEQLVEEIGDAFNSTMTKAQSMAGEVNKAFKVETLSGLFTMFQNMTKGGADINKLFDLLGQSVDTSNLIDQLKKARLEIEALQERNEELEAELSDALDATGLEVYKERVEELEETLSELQAKLKKEFEAFLDVNGIDRKGEFAELARSYTDAMEEMNMTSLEAQREFKNSKGFLLDPANQPSSASIDYIRTLDDTLRQLIDTVSQFRTVSAGGTGVIDDAIGIVSTGGGISSSDLAEIKNIVKESVSSKENIEGMARAVGQLVAVTESGAGSDSQWIAGLVQSLNELAHVDNKSIGAISGVLYSLRQVSGARASGKSLEQIVKTIKELTDIGSNLSNLTFIKDLDFEKFSKLSSRKAALESMATYLPKLAEIDYSNIKTFSEISFENLNNLSINKGSLQGLADAAEIFKASGGDIAGAAMAGSLTTLAQSINELKAAFESMGKAEEGSEGKAKTLGEQADTLARKQTQLNTVITTTHANLKRWSDAAGTKPYEGYAQGLTRLNDLFDRMDGLTASQFDNQFNKIKSDMSEFVKQIENANQRVKAPDMLTPDTSKIEEVYARVVKRIADIRSQLAKADGVETNDTAFEQAIANLRQSLEDLEGLRDGLDVIKSSDFEFDDTVNEAAEAFKKYSAQADTATTTVKEFVSAQNEADKASVKREQSLKKVQSLLSKMDSVSSQWSDDLRRDNPEIVADFERLRDKLTQLNAAFAQGTIGPDEFNRELNEASASFGTYEARMRDAEQSTRAFGTSTQAASGHLVELAQDFARSISIVMIVQRIIEKLKEMVKVSIEIESAMTRIQIVTGASDREMTTFFSAAVDQAKELGASITDVANSIETFSRLGFNLADASTLSKFATVMANVGDTTVDAATTGLTSIIKGYGMRASDAEHVTDVLVQVGQKYAISAEELMEAFERGGAALSASGTSFEQSAALFAATNAALQNAANTGTMWKTNYCLYVWKHAYRTYLIAGNA